MVASDFEGLRGYGTLEYEGQVPIKPYSCCVFQASICIAIYGMSMPSLHSESTDSVIQLISIDLYTEHYTMLQVCSSVDPNALTKSEHAIQASPTSEQLGWPDKWRKVSQECPMEKSTQALTTATDRQKLIMYSSLMFPSSLNTISGENTAVKWSTVSNALTLALASSNNCTISWRLLSLAQSRAVAPSCTLGQRMVSHMNAF